MDLQQYLRVLRAHALLIVVVVVACTAVASVLAWTKTPIYASRTQLFIATPRGASLSETYQGALFSQERVLSYAPIVSSPYVVERVIKKLHLNETVPEVQSEIHASVPAGTVLIDVTVKDRLPARAQAIAAATATEFARFATRLESARRPNLSPVRINLASPPDRPVSPISPRKRLELVVGVFLGAILGIGSAAMMEALKPTSIPKTRQLDSSPSHTVATASEDSH